MKCKHYKKEGYGYHLNNEEDLLLCDQCNLNLAGELMHQLATEVFTESMIKRRQK